MCKQSDVEGPHPGDTADSRRIPRCFDESSSNNFFSFYSDYGNDLLKTSLKSWIYYRYLLIL